MAAQAWSQKICFTHGRPERNYRGHINDQEAIRRHITPQPLTVGRRDYSTFTGALTDARHATGRDLLTGQTVRAASPGYWLGSIGYMVLLEQIGKCFRPAGARSTDSRAFVRALELFTDLLSDERLALYALRCCFAHEFRVLNVNTDKPGLTHSFRLTEGDGPVVRLANPPWSGDFSEESIRETVGDLRAFGDMVERIVAELHRLNDRDELRVTLKDGAAGLRLYALSAWS
jgi:hypothetical protein